VGRSRGRPPNVEKLAQKADAKRLVRTLEWSDPTTDRDGRMVDLGAEVRAAAAAALAGIDSPLAHDGLLRAMRDPDDDVRVAAVRGLRERGDPAAVEPLAIAVMSWVGPERARSRSEALDALAALGPPDLLRRIAADLTERSADQAAADAAAVGRLAVAAEGGAAGASVDELLAELRDGPDPGRARMLLVWRGAESVEPLVDALDDTGAQREAALALGSLRDSRAVEPLSELLRSSGDPAVRRAAAWALGEIRDPAAVGTLLAATGDRDYEVRTEAIAAFDRLGNAAVAFATSAMVRPALEDGAGAPAEIAAGEEAEPEPVAAAEPAAPPAAATPPAAPPAAATPAATPAAAPPPPAAPSPATRPAAPPPATRPRPPSGSRAGPLLRRLLGGEDR
jgi:HEAT repeat protein